MNGVVSRNSRYVSLTLYAIAWVVVVAPLAALIFHTSPRAISRAIRQPNGFSPIEVSLLASLIALALIVSLGTPLAYGLARHKVPFSGIIRFTLQVSVLLPPLVVGLLLVYLLGPYSFLGHLISQIHLSATNTFLAVVIAELYESIPYYLLGAEAGFRSVDPSLEQAAGLLGDSPRQVLYRITIPLASPQLASSLAFAWARSLGAFGAVIVVAYNPHNLPMQIYLSLQDQGLAQSFAYAMLFILVALPVPLIAYSWSAHRLKFLGDFDSRGGTQLGTDWGFRRILW